MRKLVRACFLLFLILVLISSPLRLINSAGAEQLGGLSYVWWNFGNRNFEKMDIKFTVYNDISTSDGLYFQLYQGKINGVAFYFGIQTRVFKQDIGLTGKGIIFSRWGTSDLSNARTPPGGWSASGDEGGQFVGIRKSYSWTAHQYLVRIKYEGSDNLGDWYGIYIRDLSIIVDGTNEYIGSLRFPFCQGDNKGIDDGGGSWTEIYYKEVKDSSLPGWHVSIDDIFGVKFDQTRCYPRSADLICSDNFQNINMEFRSNEQSIHLLMGQGVTKQFSKKTVSFTRQSGYDYLIITSDNIADSSGLDEFVEFKKKCGYRPNIVTVSSIQKQSIGSDLPETIRNFLIKEYSTSKIKYLLLVGDPFNSSTQTLKSTGGTVPMRYCYPDPSNHSQDGAVPTDYYYADLTGDWDFDKDGYFGEYNQDKVDFNNEIAVGRIPFDDPTTIHDILKKSILFELRSEDSKKKILMAAGIEHAEADCKKTDLAALMEATWLDFLKSKGFSRVTMYEKEGIDPSTYSCDLPLSRENFMNQISKNSFGVVAVITEWGNYNEIDRVVWKSDSNNNGLCDSDEYVVYDVLKSDDLVNLSISSGCSIYLVSAYLPSKPDIKNGQCLSKTLLTTGAVAVVGGSSTWWFSCGWSNEKNGGTQSIDYYFIKGLADKKSIGEALYNSLVYYSNNFMFSNWQWSTWQNLLSLACLYGDPSIGIFSVTVPISPPSAPFNLSATSSGSSIRLTWNPSTPGIYPILGYAVYRGYSPGGEDPEPILTTGAETTSITDSSVSFDKTYYYCVKAYDAQGNYSTPSNEVSISLKDTTPPNIDVTYPQDGLVTEESSVTVTGYATDADSGVSKITINGMEVPFNTAGYFSFQVFLSDGSNTITVVTTDRAGNRATRIIDIKCNKSIVLILQINNKVMMARGEEVVMDVAPIIIEGRTLLPIRWVMEPLGAVVSWNNNERKVTVNFKDKVIELWIENPKAKVNGNEVWIDSSNHKVAPLIIKGRTMLPVRFVAENLGCTVDWNGKRQTITIKYTNTD